MCSYFAGAVYVDGSNIVLNGESDFANNRADFGGTIVKHTLSCSLNDIFRNYILIGCQGQDMSFYVASSQGAYLYKRVIPLERDVFEMYFQYIYVPPPY